MTPKFCALKQQHSFHYSSWILWVKNLGRTELGGSRCGARITVKRWLEQEQWHARGWSSHQLRHLFTQAKALFKPSMPLGSVGFLPTWRPQGNQAACTAGRFLERSKPLPFMILPRSYTASFLLHFIFARETQAFPESRGREWYSISWWGSDKILEEHMVWEILWCPSLENTTCH